MTKFDPVLFLKWLDAKSPLVRGFDFQLFNQCLLAAVGPDGRCVGLTVFEPRALSDSFFERMNRRAGQGDLANCKLRLYLPRFLKSRIEGLLTSFSASKPELEFTSFIHVHHTGEEFKLRDRLRVVNVDDSPVVLKLLLHFFREMGFVDVVGQISDSRTAAANIHRLRPDVVTLDIQMPQKNGVEVLTELLKIAHYPVLMISSLSAEEGSLVFEALNCGAFDYLQKPRMEEREEFIVDLSQKLLMAAEGHKPVGVAKRVRSQHDRPEPRFDDNLIWCLGASTGGTQALTQVFTSLPAHIPPTLVVQHIPPVFSKAFAQSLDNLCPFSVKEAVDGEPLLANHVYVAPGGMQMGVVRRGGRLILTVQDLPQVNRFKPSVDYLFRHLAEISNVKVVAAILTGMGRDGAEGLLALKKNGARTLAQSENSCAVFGMPRVASEIGAVDEMVDLGSIGEALLSQSQRLQAAG